jgi:hypothetical protein
MKKMIVLAVLVLSVLTVFAATYYSLGSLPPNLNSSWNSARDGSGSAPANFSGADSFIIQFGHNMTTTATWAVSNASSLVEIENGGVLKAVTGSLATLTGIFQIDGGGVYAHAVTGTGTATVPGAAGRRFANSTNGGLGNGTFEIQAQSNGFATTGITWGNVVVNNTTQSSALGYAATFADVEGDFTVKSTNSQQFRFTSTQTTAHVIKGNLTVQNAASYLAFKSSSNTVNVTVWGNVNVQGGTLALVSGSTSGTANLYFRGNLDLNGGTLTEVTSATNCTIYSDGSSAQTFTNTGGTISNDINFVVPSGKTLNLSNSVIDGSSGAFTLADGGSLRLSHPEGIASSGSSGAIQVSGTRTFGTAANYEYFWTADMITGSGLPATVNNLTFNSLGLITLSNNLAVNGIFNVINGGLKLGDNNFVAAGSVPLNPIFVYNGTGVASGMGNNSIITVETANPTSLPSQINQLEIAVGTGNIMYLPNNTFTPNLIFTSGAVAVGDYIFGVGGSPAGDAQVIYDGTGRIECNGANLQITITTATPGTLPGETGSLIINTAGTVIIPNNVHLGTFSMLAGAMDLNNKSVYISDVAVDLSGASILSNLQITRTDTPTIVSGTQASISRIWNITGTSSAPFNLTLFWLEANDNGYDFSTGSCQMWKYISGAWSDLGMRGVVTNEGVHSTNIMATLGAKDTNGDYTITGDELLPVVLSSFTAILSTQQFINLAWTTQSETNLTGYRIYRGAENNINTAMMMDVFIAANNTSNVSNYGFTDEEAEPGYTWYYWLQYTEMDGSAMVYGPVSVYLPEPDPFTPPLVPLQTGLHSIYPNPFNPSTNVAFALDKDAFVRVQVFNQKGQLVSTILSGYITKGTHSFPWNCIDSNGFSCPSGVYFFKMTAGNNISVRKALLMK